MDQAAKNRKLAWMLAGLALLFLVGFVVRIYLNSHGN